MVGYVPNVGEYLMEDPESVKPVDSEELVRIYGYGVCDAFGSKHCVGRCYCRIDCSAKPIPEKFLGDTFEV